MTPFGPACYPNESKEPRPAPLSAEYAPPVSATGMGGGKIAGIAGLSGLGALLFAGGVAGLIHAITAHSYYNDAGAEGFFGALFLGSGVFLLTVARLLYIRKASNPGHTIRF